MKKLNLFVLWFSLCTAMQGQTLYNQVKDDRVKHHVAQINQWRYVLKKPLPKEPVNEVYYDTIYNKDGSIKYIDSSLITPNTVTDSFEYPDTALIKTVKYNKKGLPIYIEEPYQYWHGQKKYATHDKRGRMVQQLVYKDDTVLYNKYVLTYNDAKKEIYKSLRGADDKEDFFWIWKYDKKNRLIERAYSETGDSVLKYKVLITYNEKENSSTWTSYEYGKVDLITRNYHDKKNNLILAQSFTKKPNFIAGDKDSMLCENKYYTYDEHNNVTLTISIQNNSDSLPKNIAGLNLKKGMLVLNKVDTLLEEEGFTYDKNNNRTLQYKRNYKTKHYEEGKAYYHPNGLLDYYDWTEDNTITRYKLIYTYYKK